MEELKQAIKKICKELFEIEVEPELSRPDEQFGDFSTNVAMQLASKLANPPAGGPKEIAEQITAKLDGAQVAGPGFINIHLSDEQMAKMVASATDLPKPLTGKEILVEFGDPNPFKEMHIGHAYSYIVGDAVSSLLEASGAKVERLSYHGDVGLHVAKTIWGMQNSPDFDREKVDDISQFYVAGNKVYESDEKFKAEIEQINQKIYSQDDPEVNELCEWGKSKSFAYFDQILKDLGVHSAARFLESRSAVEGQRLVEQNMGKVFEYGDQAITLDDKKPVTKTKPVVFRGEKVGLHTRVFITGNGIPTYETKDLGLAELKKQKYPKAGQSIIITAHEQAEYFKVMLAALAEIDKETAEATKHLYHGFVSLSSGKMSSRSGDVYSALSFIADVDEAVEKTFGQKSGSTRNAAIKYGFLKHRLGSDIVYDVEQSVSLEGNSGPYLQYAHARARSILQKSNKKPVELTDLKSTERSLARKISEFPEVVAEAIKDFAPSHICTYLYELAQSFNSFYEQNRVIGDKREGERLALVEIYASVLKSGLGLLNIDAPNEV